MHGRIKFLGFVLLLVVSTFLFPHADSGLLPYGEMNIASYAEYDRVRMADPATGEIPKGIRRKELEFAQSLPMNVSRSLSWNLIGPRDLGGRTRALAFDVRNENILLAGGVTGGVWRSVNGGANFVKTTDPSQMHSVTCLVQDTRVGHEDTWYAGTGEYYGVVSGTSFSSQFSGDGIFKSTDNGLTWTLLPSTSSNTPQSLYTNGDMDFVWKMVIDHTNAAQDEVYAAVYNGVFRSVDGGVNWQAVLGFDSTTTSTSDYSDIIITPSGVLYAALSSDGPDRGIWRSTDGINWTKIDSGFPGTYGRLAMCFNPQNENELMLVCESPGSGSNGHSLFKYTYLSGAGNGAGGQWENRSANLPAGHCTGFFDFDFGYFQTQGGYDMHIAWHPVNDSVIFVGGTNLYRSEDQFTSPDYDWIGGYQCDQSNLANYVYPNHHPDQHGLIFLPSDPTKALTCSDGGVHKSNDILADSVFWTSLNNGYITSQFYTVALEEGDVNNDFLIGGAQDNGVWFTNRNHVDSLWKWVYRGDGSYLGIPNGRPYYIFSIQQGKMYKMMMTDEGDTIMGTRIDPTGGPSNYNFINAFAMDPWNPERLYNAGRVKLWRNDSLSTIPMIGDIYNTISHGWTALNSSQIGINDGFITVLEISRDDADRIYYGSSKSKIFRLDQSSGASPVKTQLTGPFHANAYTSSIGANPFNADELLVTFSNYGVPSIFYSNDAGASFSDVSGNLEQNADGSGNGPAVYWATIYPTYPTPTYFVGTSVGLFSTNSLNGAATIWAMEGANEIGRVVINMIKARPSDGKIVVATHGNGIYSAQLPPVFVSVPDANSHSFQFATYPNPFHDLSTVDLILPTQGSLNLRVLDLSGKQVEVLFSGEVSAGQQRIFWSRSTDLASGTYLLVADWNGERIVRRVIVK